MDAFSEKLQVLLPHSFIAKQQSAFQTKLKSELLPGKMITADFSENYSVLLQDAAQDFHWNNLQATIHPFIVYYKDSDELKHICYVVISDSLRHNTVAVHLFQKSLICFLREKFGTLSHKIYYFSDGAASQYKIGKIPSSYAFMKQSLVYMYLPSGIFLLHLMAKQHVMALVVQ